MYLLNTLTELELKAKQIKEKQNISYNQALQIASKQEGYSTYQAFLSKIEKVYCADENEYIKDFKSNIFKIKNLKIKYDKINNDDKYDNNEDERKELLENILRKADEIAKSIADLIFPTEIVNFSDSEVTSLEAPCFNIYTSSNGITVHNDINGDKADFWLEITLYSESLELGYRGLENYKEVGFRLPTKDEANYFDSINIKLP